MIRTTLTRAAVAAALVAGAAGALATPAAARVQNRTEAGLLECRGSPSVSFIIGSVRTLDCTFKSVRRVRYSYEGTIRRWGLDVGITGRNVLVWSVLAPTRFVDQKDLSGTYTGVSGSVALGLGLGANALLGGSNRTIALQPVSIEGQTGVNLAVGVGSLQLRQR